MKLGPGVTPTSSGFHETKSFGLPTEESIYFFKLLRDSESQQHIHWILVVIIENIFDSFLPFLGQFHEAPRIRAPPKLFCHL